MRKLEDIQNIHCVPYVHADHAWTNSRQWHIKRYVEGMARVLDYMQENPDYTFLIDNVLHYYAVIERFLPEQLEEVRQRVREGRICIANGGMSLARPYNYGDELYLRNAVAGRQALQQRFPEADIFMFFNADTGVGHSQLPQLLTQTGHSHYRFYRPENALDKAGVPREFIWKGLDGTQIVATRGYYGSFMEGACCDDRLTDWEEKKAAFVKEELEARLPYTETGELYMNIGSDDTFPQKNVCDRDRDITGFMAQWNRHEKSRMFYSTPRAYHQALTAHPLPVWEGLCDPVDLFYNSPVRSALALTRLRFTTEQLLLQAERLQVILLGLGGSVDPALLPKLWDLLFTYSGHAMQWLLKDDYDEMLARADLAIAQARLYTQELLLQIAQAAGSDRPDTYILVNPELYSRKETLSLVVTTAAHVQGLRLFDQDGKPILYQILDGYEGDKPYANKDYNEVEVAFTVELPPMSIRRIYAQCSKDSMLPQAQQEVFLWAEPLDPHTPVELDNGRYCFTIADGVVRKVQDKLDPSVHLEAEAFGQLRFYKTDVQIASGTTWDSWDDDTPAPFSPVRAKFLQRGPERWKLEISGTLYGLDAAVTVTTEKDSPTLHFDYQFDCKGDDGYFAVAFPCQDAPNIVAGIPFGAEPRDLTKVGYSEDFGISKEDYLYFERSCNGGFCANRFVSFASGSKRILLTQDDAAYLYRHNRSTHEVETFLMRSVDTASQEKLWMRNAHPSRTGVGPNTFSFTASVLDANANCGVQEKIVSRNRFPVLSVPLYHKYPRPVSACDLFHEVPENLTVTACYLQEEHLILRLYENSGEGFSGLLNIHSKLQTATLCDLLGNPQQQLSVADGAVRLHIKPWQIVNLQLCIE